MNVREPVVNGMFYPANKDKLLKMISNFLIHINPRLNEKKELLGFISPHAGYIYSGQCAAYSYKLIKSLQYDTIIVLGPSHYTSLNGASIWSQGLYRTPLGDVPIDEEAAQYLIKKNKNIERYEIAHMQEHSIEVQVPFLQYILKNKFKLVPMIIGNPTYNFTSELASSIYALIKSQEKRYLIIASSDLSHYHSDDVARRLDKQVIDLIKQNDPKMLAKIIDTGQGEACGIGPILTLLFLAQNYKQPVIDILNYTNSGEVSGDKSRVVGYLSAAVYI